MTNKDNVRLIVVFGALSIREDRSHHPRYLVEDQSGLEQEKNPLGLPRSCVVEEGADEQVSLRHRDGGDLVTAASAGWRK